MSQKNINYVRIIGKNNGVGLKQDAEILISLIEAMGMNAIYESPLKDQKENMPYIKYRLLRVLNKNMFLPILSLFCKNSAPTMNIFLEHIDPYYLPQGQINCIMPNPEFCKDTDIKLLPKMDYVLCKTHFTEKIFSSFSPPTYFTGFTSQDCLDSKVTSKSETFFHLAGRSLKKGTKLLTELWSKHPDWPNLTVVLNPQVHEKTICCTAKNISYIFKYLDQASLQTLQNKNLFHLCPSEAEGFGHYIVEAMSCGAITLTTDAPPMNELVTHDRGVLVKYKSKSPLNHGKKYHIDCSDLEKQIVKMIGMSSWEKKTTCTEARYWFIQNDTDFKGRFKNFLQMIKELS